MDYKVQVGDAPQYRLTVCFKGEYDRFSILTEVNFDGESLVTDVITHHADVITHHADVITHHTDVITHYADVITHHTGFETV